VSPLERLSVAVTREMIDFTNIDEEQSGGRFLDDPRLQQGEFLLRTLPEFLHRRVSVLQVQCRLDPVFFSFRLSHVNVYTYAKGYS
jgi:hypothetical protein